MQQLRPPAAPQVLAVEDAQPRDTQPPLEVSTLPDTPNAAVTAAVPDTPSNSGMEAGAV